MISIHRLIRAKISARESDASRSSSKQLTALRATDTTSDESRLLSRLQAGDEAAFTQLIHRYHASMLRLARLFVSEHEIAEEVVQEAWLAVINGLRSFEGRASVKTWIFRILVNRAKTRGKRESRSISFSSLTMESGEKAALASEPYSFSASGAWNIAPSAWSAGTPEEILQRKEALELIEQAIGKLPPNQQAVITLHDIEEFTPEEVRNVLEISETNVRVLLHRARCAVRRALDDYFTGK
jgi:RNA polymerase sigma-70 factor (ECF subfamily)